ncbi:MAG: arsenate reductase ArsC [Candidatus Omnitrophota bacterium]
MMKKRVLFLCTGNSCRSQMAEGFLRSLGGDRFEAYSAGVDPTEINPLSVRVMSEAGLDISAQRSKSVGRYVGHRFDYVITVCDNARQTCPFFAGRCQRIHWDIEDPAAAGGADDEKLIVFRKTRDLIERHVLDFLKSV